MRFTTCFSRWNHRSSSGRERHGQRQTHSSHGPVFSKACSSIWFLFDRYVWVCPPRLARWLSVYHLCGQRKQSQEGIPRVRALLQSHSFPPTTPSRCCGREGCVSQVTALSSAHSRGGHTASGGLVSKSQAPPPARHSLPCPAKPQTAKAREAQGAMNQSERTSLRPLGGRGSLSRLKRPSFPAPLLTLRCPWEPAETAQPKELSLCALSSGDPAHRLPPLLRPRAKRLLFWSGWGAISSSQRLSQQPRHGRTESLVKSL